MKRTQEDLPAGAAPRFDLDRGQEVVFVTEDLEVRSWKAPYCGSQSFTAPKFRATTARLAELEAGLRARAPLGSTVTVLRCAPPGEDGTGEWTAHIAVEHSSHNIGD